MNTLNFPAKQNILWSIFCVSSETIFQQFRLFIKESWPKFLRCSGQKVFGWEPRGPRPRDGEANALLHYLWWIDNNNCAALAASWAKYVKRIAFIDSVYKMHLLWKLICNIKSIFISSPNYLFYLSPLCCAGAVSGLHLYIATLLLLLRGNVLIQGYIVFTSTQMI